MIQSHKRYNFGVVCRRSLLTDFPKVIGHLEKPIGQAIIENQLTLNMGSFHVEPRENPTLANIFFSQTWGREKKNHGSK